MYVNRPGKGLQAWLPPAVWTVYLGFSFSHLCRHLNCRRRVHLWRQDGNNTRVLCTQQPLASTSSSNHCLVRDTCVGHMFWVTMASHQKKPHMICAWLFSPFILIVPIIPTYPSGSPNINMLPCLLYPSLFSLSVAFILALICVTPFFLHALSLICSSLSEFERWILRSLLFLCIP